MKKFSAIIGILIVAALAGYGGYYSYLRFTPHENPDPNHTHADFAVWVNGMHLNFTGAQYMSGLSADAGTHPTDGFRKFLHLHDGNGHVMHRHKPGLTLGEFFASLGLPMEAQCMTLDATQFAALDAGWKADFAIQNKLCTNGKFHWMMYVNGTAAAFDAAYAPADGDKILLTYDAADTHEEQLRQLTDDACRYSQTCPWKGAPPTENCIADPEVPCTM
jgi:hypothetical protein